MRFLTKKSKTQNKGFFMTLKLLKWIGIMIVVSIAQWLLFLARGHTMNEIWQEL